MLTYDILCLARERFGECDDLKSGFKFLLKTHASFHKKHRILIVFDFEYEQVH